MIKQEKFLFEYSFDESEEEDVAPTEPDLARELLERQAEIDAAFRRGREEGIAETADSDSKRLASTVEVLIQQLRSIEEARAEIERNAVQSAVEISVAILRKALPVLARESALSEIEATFSECLRRAIDEPRVVLRVSDAMLDLVRDRVDDAARRAGFQGKVVLLAEDGLGPSDCRMEWADGGADLNLDRLWGEIEDAVRRNLHASGAAASEYAATPTAPLN